MERIKVKNVSKVFQIGFKKRQTTLERAVSVFSDREPKKTLRALHDISFTANEGEIVGIIGRNGCGKSTLLRVIAGILSADSGTVHTKGRVVPLIGLNAGIRDKLTMKENIFLVCAFLGFDETEVIDKFDSIVAFSELEAFVETKWYQFSDGMKLRVLSSITLHVDPVDILLLDEVFAVGDESFRQKSLDGICELVKKGSTIVVAGHILPFMLATCHRILWIDRGKIKMDGSSKKVINAYEEYEEGAFH